MLNLDPCNRDFKKKQPSYNVSAVDAVQSEPDEIREAAEGSAVVVVCDASEQGECRKTQVLRRTRCFSLC